MSVFSEVMLKLTSSKNRPMRGVVTDNGLQFSIHNFITNACNKTDDGAYARKTWSNMIKEGSANREACSRLVTILKLPGSTGPGTPCTDIRGLQCILTLLDSKVSTEYRALLNDTFLRYVAGDKSMIKEIEANHESTAPMNVVAREALERGEGESKKRKAEISDVEYQERVMGLQARAVEIRNMNIAGQLTAMDLLARLSTGGKLDDRDRIMFKDNIKNLMTQGNPPVPGSQLALPDPDGDLKTVSDLLRDGHRFTPKETKAIGKIAAKNYRRRYGEAAEFKKQEQFVGGRACPVNAFSAKDHDLVREAIREYEDD